MLGHQFSFSAAPVRRVMEVQFGIFSAEEIVRYLYSFAPASSSPYVAHTTHCASLPRNAISCNGSR